MTKLNKAPILSNMNYLSQKNRKKELTEKQVLDKYKAGKLKPNEYRIIKGSLSDAIKDSKRHSNSLKIIPKKTGGYIGIGKALRGYGSVRKV